MYVVKRPFKNFGTAMTAGTVIKNPADIKRFKCKLAEGKIVEVTEQSSQEYHQYFKLKYGVDIYEDANKGNDEDANKGNDEDVNKGNDEDVNKNAVQVSKHVTSNSEPDKTAPAKVVVTVK